MQRMACNNSALWDPTRENPAWQAVISRSQSYGHTWHIRVTHSTHGTLGSLVTTTVSRRVSLLFREEIMCI